MIFIALSFGDLSHLKFMDFPKLKLLALREGERANQRACTKIGIYYKFQGVCDGWLISVMH
ncbi:hypothetical protein BPLS_P2208 [Bathymodiolus platifrons methanotrophic gill symbiont]|nr:hypothetical protein BMR10_03770 [Methylococcaceae bacterium CS4]TXL00266.1 hypothetical protein BMR11_03775 [Methylococcaceae bacterium CS5]TXL05868.1 hypothetical protein BMR07_08510 [Methylococcaceae bacterium CS1]TXL07103.1 hypothetical protein BMR09_06475 [Methylococcaceae bacterium CS3]TXL11704.1 hypothetical protein BMR08_03100 [Methylococcaceae bacterium CS2]GFO75165.1 hypothetical protein BPLS_P2208 [Bathymodiolus platifrons methanotrophic gill symbiont]